MAETQKRPRSITRLFLNEDGVVTARAREDTVTVIFKYQDEKETRFDLAKIFGGKLPQAGVGRAAAAFGISTSAGNAGNTAAAASETDDPDVVREAVEDRLEVFSPEDGSPGEWSAEREAGGPRTSILLEALVAFRKERGAESPADKIAAFREKFKDKDYTKKQMASAAFRAHYERIKAEKAQARAAKAAQEAQGSASTPSDLLD